MYEHMFLFKRTMSLKVVVFFCVLLVATAERVNPSSSNVKKLIRKVRMIGGNEAQPHEFPHMVSIAWGNSHSCGGAILNENWVVTAGHCSNSVLKIKAGKHSLENTENTEQIIDVDYVIVHQKYRRGVGPHDIALLRLKRPLVFNEYVQPIALPENGTEVSGRVILSGWGKMQNSLSPDKLRRGEMNIIDFDACQKADIVTSGETPSDVTRSHLCTGPEPNGVFACNLDSGSPLIKRRSDKTKLVGIFSWLIRPCGTKGAPSVFTKVSSYVDWIKSTMNYTDHLENLINNIFFKDTM